MIQDEYPDAEITVKNEEGHNYVDTDESEEHESACDFMARLWDNY